MRSPRKVYLERIAALCDDSNRYVDCAVKVRVWRRGPDGNAKPAELLPKAYGGVYDRFAARYDRSRKPEHVVELKVHAGQLPVLERIGRKGLRRVLALGAPGGGKTMAIVVVAIILGVRRPNAMIGVVAPTDARLLIVWRKLLELLEPAGLLASAPSIRRKEIKLVNGTVFQCRSAARRSTSSGSPLAGLDWHDAVEDEQQDQDDQDQIEVDARLRINADGQVFSSATNVARHQFQLRIQRYEASGAHEVQRFSGPDNAFTSLDHWEALKRDWSPEDYDRYVRCLDVPREGRVFPRFSYAESCATLPAPVGDITARLVLDKFKTARDYIIGWDPGVIASVSVILKAYAPSQPGFNGQLRSGTVHADDRHWYVLDEVTTRDATTEHHARDLTAWLLARGIPLDRCIVIGDPHENKEADESDYIQMRAAGFLVKPSNYGNQIHRKHRISMTNALIKDAAEVRRLFLAKSPAGTPYAQKTAECLGHLMYRDNGEIDYQHKTARNLAHWGEALGYGVFPWEQYRGAYKPAQEPNMPQPWRRRLGS